MRYNNKGYFLGRKVKKIMNEQTRYVMGLYQIGILIRDTIEYLMPAGEKGYSVEAYTSRGKMLAHLLEEGSPFTVFCKNNKAPVKDKDGNETGQTIGDRISGQVHEFYDSVYGENANIVRLDHGKVYVETSLSIQLIDYIVGLHETIADICVGFREQFRKAGTLESDLDTLLTVDDPFYRSLAFRAVAVSFNSKFIEYNNSVRQYIAAERENNGVDPSTQPGFDPKVDPSCAFISNEMGRLVGFFNFLNQHNKSTDVIFLDSIKRMQDGFGFFSGQRKLPEGAKLQDVMNSFANIFTPLIPGYRDAWVRCFTKVFSDLTQYEQKMISERNKAKAEQPAADQQAPASDDKKN